MTDLIARLQHALGDDYAIERELAGGGMSRVFVATQRSLGRSVVIKALPEDMIGALSIERFRREIRLAASLQQANIVPVLAAGEADEIPFYTMPFVKGDSLRLRLDEHGALPLTECVAIMRDVARALAFAHGEGVVHRDIKPENVLLSGGTAVVTDFGIAKALADSAARSGSETLTHAGMTLGTPAYMAPEQAVGEAVDHRADIYAFGILAYEMLAGATPFAGRSTQATIAAHVLEMPVPLAERRADAPPGIAALVMRCLAKEPADRPSSAGALLTALENTTEAQWLTAGMSVSQDLVSIAVLPFENLSPDPTDAYFADGITDEIITDLSALQSMRVIARSSVSGFRGSAKDSPAIARELRVRYVLDGSVRRVGQNFRLTLRLVDSASGATVWSDKLGGTIGDVFSVQEALSRTIVGALRITLTPRDAARFADAPTRPAIDPMAIDAYLKGRHYFSLATADGIANALRSFEHATELDPNFAAAFAGLAKTYTYATITWQALPPREAMPKAKAAATRALQLDPRLAEAHVALGRIANFYDWDVRAAGAAFREAIRLNANDADAHIQYSCLLATLETRFAEAAEQGQLAVSLSPLDPLAYWFLGFAQYYGRDYAARIETCQRLIALHPHWGFGYFALGASLSTVGRPEEATTCHLRAIELDGRSPHHVTFLGVSYALSGNTGAAFECLAELETLAAAGRSVWGWKLIIHAVLGDRDEVLTAFERAFEERSSSLVLHLNHPFVDFVRGDPRFDALLRGMGLEHLVAYRPAHEWRGLGG